MNKADLEELKQKIDASTELSAFSADLSSALARHVGETDATFGPFLIVAIISVILQVIYLCRQKTEEEEIVNLSRCNKKIDGRRTLMIRRRLNKLWADYCAENNLQRTKTNPLIAAVSDVGENLSDDTAGQLFQLARMK
jgi:hypothetical protein